MLQVVVMVVAMVAAAAGLGWATTCDAPHPCLPFHPMLQLPDVRVSSLVASVRSAGPQGPVRVAVQGKEEEAEEFDSVVLATHSDVSLRILGAEGPQVHEGA